MDNTIYTSHLNKVTSSDVIETPFADIVSIIQSEQYVKEISEIRNEPNEQEQKRLKRENLPVFFPTLVFGSHYAFDDETDANGIVQFDVDVKDNVDLDFKELRSELQAIPELFYLYTSPRAGLKFGIKTDFNRHANEGEESLKARYKTAYELSKEYVSTRIIINFFYDPNMQMLKTGCYLSSDSAIYFNEDCDTFSVDDRCVYSVPAAFSTKIYDALTEEQVIELLSFIPRNLRNDARLPLNLAVMSVLGNSAISLLESHWTTSDKVKLKQDLNYQLKKINDGSFTGKVGLLIEMAKENGYVHPRANRLTNRINFDFEKVDHTFPKLSNDTNIPKLLDDAIESGASQLFRISTGSGKSDKVAEVISGKERKDTYLLLCDTNENIDKHVERINKYYSKRVANPLKIPGTPTTVEDFKYMRANPASRAISIKGKLAMCNKINQTIDFDLAFQKKYSNYIPNDICQGCFLKDEGDCNYYNQANPRLMVSGNIYVLHFNTLYNEISELFKERIPYIGHIKAIIVDENAVQHIANGLCRCIIANDITTDKVVTNHNLLIDIFKAAYNLTTLDLSSDEIKNLPVIYGKDLQSILDNTNVTFKIKKVLKDYIKQVHKKHFEMSGNPFPTKVDVYENILNYLSTKDEKYLFGMRIAGIKIGKTIACAGFIQGEIKKINEQFADTKIIYLDATMNLELVHDALLPNRNVEKIQVDIKMSDDIKILQMTGVSCSKSSLQTNNRLLPIIEHAKKHIAEYGLQDKKGGLITFKKFEINNVVDENFVDTAANLLWGDDYNNRGNLTRYFGNTRGYDEMQDCDYMILIGDYNLPSHALQDQFWNLYGEPVDLASHSVDHLNRMRGGSCIKTKKKQYLDPRLQSIYEHSCTAELEQALGRGRLIYGQSKTILVYSSMPLGDNVEITEFIDPNEIFPRQVVDLEILDLIKEIGFIQKKSADIIDVIGLNKNQWNDSKEDIFKNFIDAGFLENKLRYLKSKKYKTETYLVFDQVKFDCFKATRV
jgi:uncharacterized C2H2 Zn-finger protein